MARSDWDERALAWAEGARGSAMGFIVGTITGAIIHAATGGESSSSIEGAIASAAGGGVAGMVVAYGVITVIDMFTPDPLDAVKALRRGGKIIDAVEGGSDINRAAKRAAGGAGGGVGGGGMPGGVVRGRRTFPHDPDQFLPGRPYTPINAGRRWGPNGRIKFEYHDNDGKGYPHWHIEEKFKPPVGKSRWRKHPHYPHEFLPGAEIPEEFWDWLDRY